MKTDTLEYLKKYYYILLIILTAIFVLFLSNYRFYSSDQTTQIPSVFHFFDNELYEKDFTMQIINPLGVKTILHLILFSISMITFIPIHWIYFAAYIMIIYSIFYLTYKISNELYKSFFAGIFACFLLFLFAKGSILQSSGFEILSRSIVPYFAAVPLHLLCLYLVLKKKYLYSVLMSGFLFYIHGQISIFTLIPILISVGFCLKKPVCLIKYLLVYLLVISPIIISLLLKFNPLSQTSAKYSIKELSMLRVPFHIFPNRNSLIIFFGFILFFLLMMHINKVKIKKEFIYWNYALIAIYFSGIIFTRFIPLDLIMLMYLLRVDVFIRIFFLILASITFISFLLSKINKKKLQEKYLVYLLFAFFLIILLILSAIKSPQLEIHHPHHSYEDIADYAKNNTPKYSLFITPPSLEGFRLYSQRSIVVDFKTNPIGRGSEIQDEWMQRLLDLCNVEEFNNDGFEILPECEEGYKSLTMEDFSSLCKKYNADYFVAYYNKSISLREDILIYGNSGFLLLSCPK